MSRTQNIIVFSNGNFMRANEVLFPVTSPGVLCGFGIFETMRSYRGRIVYISQHIRRLKDSARRIGMDLAYSDDALKKHIAQTVEKNAIKDAMVRLTVWDHEKKPFILITSQVYEPHSQGGYRRGFTAQVSAVTIDERSAFAGMKTTSYMKYLHAYRTARAHGVNEAILLDTRSFLSEAGRSNLFFAKGGCLFTPSLSCGCLAGVTRQFVFDWAREKSLSVREGEYPLSDLFSSDEAFLTNSLMGVMPLVSVDGKDIRSGKPGGITRRLVDFYYNALTTGE